MLPTYHEKIKIFHSAAPAREWMGPWLEELQMLIEAGDSDEVKSHLLELVPEYIGSRESQAGSLRDAVQLRGARA
jgi:hypothetical protein